MSRKISGSSALKGLVSPMENAAHRGKMPRDQGRKCKDGNLFAPRRRPEEAAATMTFRLARPEATPP